MISVLIFLDEEYFELALELRKIKESPSDKKVDDDWCYRKDFMAQ